MKMTPIIQNDIDSAISQCTAMKEIRNSSFLITGATGFIGSYIIHTLLRDARANHANTRIYAVVRSLDKARDMFSVYKEGKEIIYVVQDVQNPIILDETVDYVIHCASNAEPSKYAEDPVGTMTINFSGTSNLLNFAREHMTKRFLYVSTIEIYGQSLKNSAMSESDYGIIDSCNPRSCYPLSKKACETLCISYGKQYNIPISIGRLSYIFGPGMKEDDSKVAALFPREVAAGHNIVMKSKGEQLRSYCYVCDAITGLLTVLACGEDQEAYNIASPKNITTIYNMAQRLVELFPEKNVKVIIDLPEKQEKQNFTFIEDSVLSSEKLERLGWKPITNLDDGLKHTVMNDISLNESSKSNN